MMTATPLLDTIATPADIRRLAPEQLPQLAQELRAFLLESVGKTGGHFASNLGVVELTIALHYVFETPQDHLVWDVGHQSYPHKILTGRKDRMHTIRQFGGLAGFPKRSESEYDVFGVGHSSTSIGAALGMAVADRLSGSNARSVAVIGDGAMTAGQAFEALNNAGDMKVNLLVVLNDNEMSISPNVGALPKYLARNVMRDMRGVLHASSAHFTEVLSILSERPVVLWDAKRYVQAGVTFGAEVFDLALADYLLRPEERQRSLDRAASAYLDELSAPQTAEDRTLSAVYSHLANGAPLHNEQIAFYEVILAAQLYGPMSAALADANLTELYGTVELPLVPILAVMERTGVAVNRAALGRALAAANARIAEIEQDIYALAGTEFNISSPKQLGEVLFDRLGLTSPKMKKTKTGYSTNAEVLEEMRAAHPVVDRVLTYRMWSKIRSTYLEGIGALIRPETGRVHTSFNQTVTATGRLSSSDPNLQNIPVRTEEGRAVRALFEPGEGYDALLSADYSQIELRILAHMSGDETLIDAFLQGQDIHARTASEVFGVPLAEVTSAQRRSAKAVNFGIVYGLSDYGLSQDLGIPRKEAAGYIERYFERYHGVRAFLDKMVADAHANGYVTTLYGRRRDLPAINSRNFMQRSNAERMAMNTPIQGTAADLIKIAMIRADAALRAAGVKSRILLQVHDELVLEVVNDEIAQVTELLTAAMSGAAQLAVPLAVDVHTGKNWAEAK